MAAGSKQAVWLIQAHYSFQGTFQVRAGGAGEARDKVLRHCGCAFGSITTSLPPEDIDWEFDTTPSVTACAVSPA